MHKKPTERLFDGIEYNPETFCWEWIRCLDTIGYGRISINGTIEGVHRVMYKYIYGNIPSDRPCILHRCDNRKCCNPMHLYAGTHQNNSDDMVNKNRSCKGENHRDAKLTDKQVIEIRASKETQVVIAKRLNISEMTISHIKSRSSSH